MIAALRHRVGGNGRHDDGKTDVRVTRKRRERHRCGKVPDQPMTVEVGRSDVGVGAAQGRVVAVVEGARSPHVRDLRVKTILLVDRGLNAFDDLLAVLLQRRR